MSNDQIRISDAIPDMPASFDETVERTLNTVCRRERQQNDTTVRTWEEPYEAPRRRRTENTAKRVAVIAAAVILGICTLTAGGFAVAHALHNRTQTVPLNTPEETNAGNTVYATDHEDPAATESAPAPVLLTPVSTPIPEGTIFLYGVVSDTDQENFDDALELWKTFYTQGVRDLFTDYSYPMTGFMNLWMQSDGDEYLDLAFDNVKGQTDILKAFYRAIKRDCPETVFHGTGFGYLETEYRKYLEENGRKDSEEYRLTEESQNQLTRYKASADQAEANAYQDACLAENFAREYEALNGASVMGVIHYFHLESSELYLPEEQLMITLLKERFGDAVRTDRTDADPQPTETTAILKAYKTDSGVDMIGITVLVPAKATVTIEFPNQDDWVRTNNEDEAKQVKAVFAKAALAPDASDAEPVVTVEPKITITTADGESYRVDCPSVAFTTENGDTGEGATDPH